MQDSDSEITGSYLGLKRNFQVMPGAEGLELLCRHIPDRYEHLGHWAPEPAERGPPAQAPDWPANAVIPLTYHPVPDIA